MLTDAQQRNAAKKFAAEWEGRGYEKGETHAFWMELLQTPAFGLRNNPP